MYVKARKGKSPVSEDDNMEVTEEDVLSTVPTIGFNVKEIQYKNVRFAVVRAQMGRDAVSRKAYRNTRAFLFRYSGI